MKGTKRIEEGSTKKHRYGLVMPVELWKRIDDAHWEQRKSVNQIIVEALEKAFNA